MDNQEIGRTRRDLRRDLDSVYLYKVLHERSLLPLYRESADAPGFVGGESDYELDVVFEAIHNLSEAIWHNYSEQYEIEILYFSHPDIMEYYRLCREHSKRINVPFSANPHVLGAAKFVDDLLEQGCYSCSYHLQTKVNHQWASGIVFRMWPEFDGHLALLILMAKIFDFYKWNLEWLKAELAKLTGRRIQTIRKGGGTVIADLKRFCVLLREAKEDEYLDTSGVSPYLMKNLFHPYMAGKDIPLDSLDYDAFGLDDLDRLNDYLGDLQTVYNALHSKTENLRKIPPAVRLVRAFC